MTQWNKVLTTFSIIFLSYACSTPQTKQPNEADEDIANEMESATTTEKVAEKQAKQAIDKIESIESSAKEREKRIFTLEKETKKLAFQVNDLNQDNRISKKLISQLKNDVNSLNEQLATNKKEIEIIKRGIRSGIFEDQTLLEKQPPSSVGVTMLPDMLESRDSYEDKSSSILKTPPAQNTTPVLPEPMGPTQMLAEAEIKLRQAQYGEAVVVLNGLKKNFPNYDDNGKSLMLAAEAWLRLGEYDNVFNELRTFYIKYPTNPDLGHAKLLEGQAYEKINSKSKAADLYQEVITLSPQSSDAQSAREGMLRMRDAK